ncbi:hypothetical protein EDB92DRAFT_2034646 [Lactarius akahatsu]|uniref:DUF6534 domain-containing protein n=1 Tax=Lactarius akahatsu TaxID=416441 RepID=A0AAD4QAI9_9AGAM|nr:hypothetical protein EDB92DRAFT_2034646 [Lactarius akahatsu]
MAESTSDDLIKLATPLLFGPLFNWALYGALCVQIYVYSYNFPNDNRSVKFLAYFVFTLETAQTALTGADVYYWFIAGFGDRERLKSSHYAPIDIAITDAIISLIVQEYFCYRIWTLNRRSSWFCLIIAITAVSQSVGAAWGGFRSVVVGKYAVSKAALYVRTLVLGLGRHTSTSHSAALVMVVAEFFGGHSDCGCHDPAGTGWPHWVLYYVNGAPFIQLRRKDEGRFTNFVLIRVVRLTIETNTLTASFVLFVAFPNEIYYTFTAGIIGKLYSNTLLVTLNNRIYFRDHWSPEHGDSARVTFSGRVRAAALTSLSFVGADPQSQASTSDSFKLDTISQTVGLEKQKGDAVSTSSQPISFAIRPPSE